MTLQSDWLGRCDISLSAHVVTFMLAKIPVGFNFEFLFVDWPLCPILLIISSTSLLCVKLLITRIFDSGFHSLEMFPFELCDLFTFGFLVHLDLWAVFEAMPFFVWGFSISTILSSSWLVCDVWLSKLSSLVCLVSFHHFGIDHIVVRSVRKLSSFAKKKHNLCFKYFISFRVECFSYLLNDFIRKRLKTRIFAFGCLSFIWKNIILHSFCVRN